MSGFRCCLHVVVLDMFVLPCGERKMAPFGATRFYFRQAKIGETIRFRILDSSGEVIYHFKRAFL